MASITPRTTAITDNDGERNLLAKILHRLNLSSSITPGNPAANVAVTNTPLPIDFDGSQPVHFEATQNVAVSNFPATQNVQVTNTPNVGVTNFPASQNVVVTNTPTVTVSGVTFQDGHLSTVAVPFQFEIAHEGEYLENGVAKAAFLFRVLGRRAGFNSTSVLQDVGEWLSTSIDTLPELSGVEDLELVSSSAQDDPSPAGTGTHSVRITYLTTGYVLASVDYALNGTAAVPVAEKMRFIYGMEALTGGAGEVSVGNIDLRIAGGGAIHERISAGGNKSLSGRFMVPDNYKAYMTVWMMSAIGTTMDARLRATVTTTSRALNGRYLFQDVAFVGSGVHVDEPLSFMKLPARAKVKVSVLPGATAVANRADVSVEIVLVQD
jgi:hypothetical protein